ncbi:hypothetical protein [Microbacterium capsulatum]|uniref:Thiosulfate dehydrogenase [quinone] large subunit n=1 Tax=Microbacterium capsulatum TaxID=3041921 RepID=A0ABU0XFN0_9MICO|nr:hypothetical protein [Microbacterium sp. ASV81]MDQ4213408.1 hypothetical protein [Microbacterium sp. ASV81]
MSRLPGGGRRSSRPWMLVAALLGGAARIAAGVLWLEEGILKYRAGFGSADILLVAHGTAGNSRAPFYFRPLGSVMQALPGLFGVAIPLLEVSLGVLLVLGLGRVLTLLAALGSIGTLMLYWSSDQLIAQYPVLVALSAAVLVLPGAERFGALWVWRRVRARRGAAVRTA